MYFIKKYKNMTIDSAVMRVTENPVLQRIIRYDHFKLSEYEGYLDILVYKKRTRIGSYLMRFCA